MFLAGNIENNGNNIELFFDTRAGGQNVLLNTNPLLDNDGLNAMAGLTFDTGFGADYYLGTKALAAGSVPSNAVLDTYFAQLTTPGAFGIDQALTGTGRVVTMNLGNGRTGTLALDNSNTGGVSDAAVAAGTPAAVVTGLEVVLPLAALGTPVGSLKVAAFVNGFGHNFLSNQALAGLPAGTANLGNPAGVNFAAAANAGNQYFTVALPAPAVAPALTVIAPASGPVGTTLTLTGTNLSGTTRVTFAGTSGNVVSTGFGVNGTGTQLIGLVVPAGATTGNVTVTTPVGTSNGVLFTVVPRPVLTGISPSSGPVGTSVTLTGTGLTGTTLITFSGASGNTVSTGFTVNAAGTQITGIVVPSGATTGTVTVTTPGGTSAGIAFTIIPRPVLTSLAPASGLVGATITLTGTGLGGASIVSFNGTTQITIAANTATGLTVTVPTGATTGNLTVTTPGGTSNGLVFTVMAPQLAVQQGTTAYASGGAAYRFGNQVVNTSSVAVAFTLRNAGTALLTIGSVTTTGSFAIGGAVPTSLAAGGTAAVNVTFTPTATGARTGALVITSSLGSYTVNLTGTGIVAAPVLASLNPTSGPVGTVVTITGTAFTGATSVSFNGSSAAPVLASATSLTATVPVGASTGAVVVTTPGGSSNGLAFTITTPTTTRPAAAGAALYPNPAHGSTTVQVRPGAAKMPLVLLDALGREVRRYPAPAGAAATLDLRGLPAGVYMLRAGTGSQRLVLE